MRLRRARQCSSRQALEAVKAGRRSRQLRQALEAVKTGARGS
jgi:hypothetical protein